MSNARVILGVGLLVGFGVLIYLLAPVLTPFLFGGLLAYILNPLVARLQRWRLPRVFAVVVVFVAFVLLLLGVLLYLFPLLQRQAAVFAAKVPGYVDWIQRNALPRLQAFTGGELPLDLEAIGQVIATHWLDVGHVMRSAISNIMQSGAQFAAWLVSLALIPVVTFYLLLDWERIPARFVALMPRAWRDTVRRLARETDEVLGSFLRGQLAVMLALAIVYSIGLWLLNLDLALPIGLTAGLVSFVPYLGFVIGILAAGAAAYLQFHDPVTLLGVLAVFLAGQALESLWLTPRLVGSRIGLHPVAVIFAVMAGGQLFGFVGILLGLPAAAALKVWLRYVHQSYTAGKVTSSRRRRTVSTRRPRP